MKKDIKKTANPDITVKVTIPENVPDRVRQNKINRLYDILKPKDTVLNKSA